MMGVRVEQMGEEDLAESAWHDDVKTFHLLLELVYMTQDRNK